MRRIIALISLVLACALCVPALAHAAQVALPATKAGVDISDVEVSSDKLSARLEGSSFALGDFARASVGSNRPIAQEYFGYAYYIGSKPTDLMYIASTKAVVVYVNESVATGIGLDAQSGDDAAKLQKLVLALDKANANGNVEIGAEVPFYLTTEQDFELDGVFYRFNVNAEGSDCYNCVIGADASDVTDSENPHYTKPQFACFATLVATEEAVIVAPPTPFEQFADLLGRLDWSPLWVTLKTTFTAIVFIFVLGLAAAYLTLHVSPRARDIFDTIFTIPMVLPPTVCGFLLLLLLGSNTALGRWFIDIGFPLIFSWPATVIAAVVVAFPLMYRNARGAFESLDPNMLDAARTLGWSEGRIFFKIMLPLAWSSIAAGTVLAFARALGEFGATLFLAGNYLGITRTIPIAIYFEWMNGNTDIALFWTAVILVFSFIVILFINLWSQHTTRYRRGAVDQ